MYKRLMKMLIPDSVIQDYINALCDEQEKLDVVLEAEEKVKLIYTSCGQCSKPVSVYDDGFMVLVDRCENCNYSVEDLA